MSGPAEAEAEGLKAHRLQRDVAGEDQQVGPGDLLAVLLLDRPEQPAGLVEVGVVRPAVERGEALRALAAAAAAVLDPVGARGVPGQPDEQAAVVAVVGRPPVLRGGHHLHDVPLEGLDVEGGELLGVVVVLAHRVGPGRVLVQDLQVQLVRPPVLVRPRPMRGGLSGRGLPGSRFRTRRSLSCLGYLVFDWVARARAASGGRSRRPERRRRDRGGERTPGTAPSRRPPPRRSGNPGRPTRSGRGCRRRRSRRRRWSRTTGTPRGGGCPRPGPRSGPRSRPARSAGPGRAVVSARSTS